MATTIGIPKSLLYYKYKDLWHVFFTELGCNIIYSPDTNKDILEKGKSLLVDESCLSMKIYMGHFSYLIGKCDYILLPHLECLKKDEELCTNFYALYDLASNIFDTKILSYNINVAKNKTEEMAFMKMGTALGFKKKEVFNAYKNAKYNENYNKSKSIALNKINVKSNNNLKILLVGHSYNIFDEFIGKSVINILEKMKINIIYSHLNDIDFDGYKKISETLYWTFNKELVNGVVQYQDEVDGIILLTSFPCGPDSLVNEVLLRSVKSPIIHLVIDELSSGTGLETRLESFVDILASTKKVQYENN